MRATTISEVVRRCSDRIRIERLDDGTIRGSLRCRFTLADIEASWFRRQSGPFAVVGRERQPPLRDASSIAIARRFRPLTRIRAAIVHDAAELAALAAAIRQTASHVEHDVYIIPLDDVWFAYVSHHEEIVLFTPATR